MLLIRQLISRSWKITSLYNKFVLFTINVLLFKVWSFHSAAFCIAPALIAASLIGRHIIRIRQSRKRIWTSIIGLDSERMTGLLFRLVVLPSWLWAAADIKTFRCFWIVGGEKLFFLRPSFPHNFFSNQRRRRGMFARFYLVLCLT